MAIIVSVVRIERAAINYKYWSVVVLSLLHRIANESKPIEYTNRDTH